jgi:hypothetical protein
MTSAERSVLIVGDDLARVDALVPLLRRLNHDVRRALRAPAASKLAGEGPLDLLVVVLPCAHARELLGHVRAAGSPSRHAAVLVVRDGQASPGDAALSRLANRELEPDVTAEELQGAVDLLLHVAPRIDLHAPLRMRLGTHPADQPCAAQVENLSSSGMLLTSREPLPLGSVFGFELDLPEHETPIRGRAQVVRHSEVSRDGVQGIGASFLSLGGEGADRIKSAVFREQAATGARRWIDGATGAGGAATAQPADRAAASPVTIEQRAMVEEQLAQLTPAL